MKNGIKSGLSPPSLPPKSATHQSLAHAGDFYAIFYTLKKTVCGFRRTRKARIRAIENHSGQTGILFFRLIDSQLILTHAGDERQAVFLRQLNPLRGRRSLGRQNGNARANCLGDHIRRQASA